MTEEYINCIYRKQDNHTAYLNQAYCNNPKRHPTNPNVLCLMYCQGLTCDLTEIKDDGDIMQKKICIVNGCSDCPYHERVEKNDIMNVEYLHHCRDTDLYHKNINILFRYCKLPDYETGDNDAKRTRLRTKLSL